MKAIVTDETPEIAEPTVPPPPDTSWRARLPRTSLSRRSKIIMLVLVVAAAGFLITLKQGGTLEHKEAQLTKANQHAAREATNKVMLKYLGRLEKSGNREQVALVERVGEAIASKTDALRAPVKLHFYLLAEPNAINLYGISNGDVYITTAMLNRMKTEGQLAAALAHGVAHALAGDGLVEQPPATGGTAKPNVWQHTTGQEAAADTLTLRLMSQAGYDPNAYAAMLVVLASAYQAGAEVTFFTSHPNVATRLDDIAAGVTALYPKGVPVVLSK